MSEQEAQEEPGWMGTYGDKAVEVAKGAAKGVVKTQATYGEKALGFKNRCPNDAKGNLTCYTDAEFTKKYNDGDMIEFEYFFGSNVGNGKLFKDDGNFFSDRYAEQVKGIFKSNDTEKIFIEDAKRYNTSEDVNDWEPINDTEFYFDRIRKDSDKKDSKSSSTKEVVESHGELAANHTQSPTEEKSKEASVELKKLQNVFTDVVNEKSFFNDEGKIKTENKDRYTDKQNDSITKLNKVLHEADRFIQPFVEYKNIMDKIKSLVTTPVTFAMCETISLIQKDLNKSIENYILPKDSATLQTRLDGKDIQIGLTDEKEKKIAIPIGIINTGYLKNIYQIVYLEQNGKLHYAASTKIAYNMNKALDYRNFKIKSSEGNILVFAKKVYRSSKQTMSVQSIDIKGGKYTKKARLQYTKKANLRRNRYTNKN